MLLPNWNQTVLTEFKSKNSTTTPDMFARGFRGVFKCITGIFALLTNRKQEAASENELKLFKRIISDNKSIMRMLFDIL